MLTFKKFIEAVDNGKVPLASKYRKLLTNKPVYRNTIIKSFRIDRQVAQKLQEAALALDCSESDLIRYAIHSHIKKT